MFMAELWSCVGDQVAAVAVAVLLYQRSGSAFIAALGYASAFLPWAVGGPLLAVYADRLPARQVVVGGDLLRAVLIGTAAIPGMPLLAIGAARPGRCVSSRRRSSRPHRRATRRSWTTPTATPSPSRSSR